MHINPILPKIKELDPNHDKYCAGSLYVPARKVCL